MAAIHTLLTILALSAFPTPSTSDPRTTLASLICNKTLSSSDTTVSSTNLLAAVAKLNTLFDNNGYGAVGVGTGPDSVYVLAQCFGDLNSTDCPLCYNQVRTALAGCLPGVGGRTFLDGCFGRYGNYSFFNEVFSSLDSVVCNSSRNSTDRMGFGQAVRLAVGNVSAAAPGGQGFAVGSAKGSNVTVYALAQCWESLDRASCTACLNAAAANVSSCSPATEGRALYTGCYLRYSTKLFWNVNQTLASPPTKGNPPRLSNLCSK